ncbi:MAG: amidohydrolase family protein [Planctomycetaceae bacterium]
MTMTSRRNFLEQAAMVVGGGLAAAFHRNEGPTLHAGEKKERAVSAEAIPIIDTHQHLWDLSKLKLSWLSGPDVKTLNRSFVTADYLQATAGLNVVKAVYMEVDADPEFHEIEAEYVIDLCKRGDSPTVAAVISGRPNSPEFPRYITRYADNPYIKGVRQILHVPSAQRGLCLEPRFVESVRLLGKLGLRFDLCMRPGEIVDGVKLVEKCPQTRFVVDHCGNMDVRSKDKALRETWMKGMREMAVRPNTVCKISGIIVTADKQNWKPDDLAPNVNFCLETFGDDRVCFAGDWPVCTLTASYKQWVEALKWIVRDRPAEFQRKLFHDNAAKFYRLN